MRHQPSAYRIEQEVAVLMPEAQPEANQASMPRSLAGKPLAGFRATPSRRNPVLYGMVVYAIRFKNPLLHRQSTLRKRRLGENRVSGQTSRDLPTALHAQHVVIQNLVINLYAALEPVPFVQQARPSPTREKQTRRTRTS